ncbi:MAG: Fe-S cluster assembly protein SufD [Cyclobacteriaceae bacterium]
METTSIDRIVENNIIESFSLDDFRLVNEERSKAITHLKKVGLPTGKSEEYRFTPITKNLQKNFNWNNKPTESSLSSIQEFLIEGIEANILVFINGNYSKSLSKIISPAAEIKIKSLSEAFETDKEALNAYFDKLVRSDSDPFAALNTAFWQNGIFVHVPENTIVEKPILILHINDATQSQVIANTRLLVVIEKNAQLSIIEKFDSVGSNAVFHTFTEEISVAENAQLEYCKVQNDAGRSTQVAATNIHQSNSSKVNTFTLTMNGEIVRNNFTITIDGEHCESHFHGIYLLNGNTLVDNHTVVDHKKPNSFSNELYKGIMDGNSKGVFNGKIFVRPQAQKTNAFQSNRNILMSETATVNTKPQLEIWADDVKCSHGCTTGQLDDEALFYLQSRGIPYDSAKAMLLYAFALDVLTPIKNETLKSYLDKLISDRLNKNF